MAYPYDGILWGYNKECVRFCCTDGVNKEKCQNKEMCMRNKEKCMFLKTQSKIVPLCII